MAKFCVLYSGSSGNCAYFTADGTSLLIDAGVSARAIKNALSAIGSKIEDLQAVLVTHEHSDHIRGLATLTKRYGLPVYANRGTIRGIMESNIDVKDEYLHELVNGEHTSIGGIGVTPFSTSHDSRDSVGYRITADGCAGVAVATDLGIISESVLRYLSGCGLVMLESNHDNGMLQNGRYPYYLKRRIMSQKGHLSNEECSQVLPRLATSGARHFILAHLSEENNFPDLARASAVSALKSAGVQPGQCTVEVAPRSGPGNVTYI